MSNLWFIAMQAVANPGKFYGFQGKCTWDFWPVVFPSTGLTGFCYFLKNFKYLFQLAEIFEYEAHSPYSGNMWNYFFSLKLKQMAICSWLTYTYTYSSFEAVLFQELLTFFTLRCFSCRPFVPFDIFSVDVFYRWRFLLCHYVGESKNFIPRAWIFLTHIFTCISR